MPAKAGSRVLFNGWREENRRKQAGLMFDPEPVEPTEFEKLLKKHCISEANAMHSPLVRLWIAANYRKRYVPEKLLAAMGFGEIVNA